MSELARITAHYFGVLLDRAGMSASVSDMHAEINAADEADESAAKRALELARETPPTAPAETPRPRKSVADEKIDRITDAAREETERGRKARRQE